ncbi:hypothetical protein GCM10010300_75520 [Streptomyces olivaceoviridis]|uniref:hypothetical protein n=1 Tax=Streptomyces olivaceoviridis TaxID=1921 RepID=UPI0016785680|nr:hypothetical protein [Streptomyces olivaceoviridis]GGZ20489.1 hypothetical protein GCM10010300_75520 [Streptomyces olivaceoviridis]
MCAGLGDPPILLTVADDAGADAEHATARTVLKTPCGPRRSHRRRRAVRPGSAPRRSSSADPAGRAGRFPTVVESSVRMRGGTAADALTGRVLRVGTPDSRRP